MAERGKTRRSTSPSDRTVAPSASTTETLPLWRDSTRWPRVTSTRNGLSINAPFEKRRCCGGTPDRSQRGRCCIIAKNHHEIAASDGLRLSPRHPKPKVPTNGEPLMHVAMIGAGYVGLVSGACFADFGHEVCCVDKDPAKIEALNRGEIPIFEPGLADLVAKNVREGRLTFTTDLAQAVQGAEAVFIAVGTPSRRGDGHADLSYVYQAARDIAAAMDGYTVIVTKSTVPVGTGDEVERIIRETRAEADFAVVSNPEFLREGAAIADFKRPDRIVIGTEDERANTVMGKLYRPLYLNQAPMLFTSRRTAELTKYAANAFLATKITFINEIADLCERVGANVDMVRMGIGSDERIGKRFLFAGIGYGGSCFPKDVKALAHTAEENHYDFRLLKSVMDVNEKQKSILVEKVKKYFTGNLKGKKIALWGLAFKPDTDDIREAPSLHIIDALLKEGATVTAFDPV